MRKNLLYILLFIAVFTTGLMVFLPYDKIVQSAVNKEIIKNNLPVRYTAVESGLFTTTFYEVLVYDVNGRYDPVELGDVKISYSPLSVFSRKAQVNLKNVYGQAQVNHTKNKITASVYADLRRLTPYFKAQLGGNMDVNINYDYINRTGDYTLSSTDAKVDVNGINLAFTSVSSSGSLLGNILTISGLTATGTAELTASGQIRLDFKDIHRSLIKAEGEGKMLGMQSRFNVYGVLANPQIKVN